MSFKDKVAIVTGGSQGIGRAYVSALLNIGMKTNHKDYSQPSSITSLALPETCTIRADPIVHGVSRFTPAQLLHPFFTSTLLLRAGTATWGLTICICDVKEETAKEFLETLPTSEKNNVIFQKCDVTSPEELRSAFEKVISVFGGIDVVINNAGIADEQNWRRTIDVNFIGVVHGIKLGFEYMGEDKGGRGGQIINTASRSGISPKVVWAPIYCATKHGIVGLTRSYGNEYHFKKTGVVVKAICPAYTDTEGSRTVPRPVFDDGESKGSVSCEAEKILKPEEVAQALIQLLEDGKNGALLLVERDGVKYV